MTPTSRAGSHARTLVIRPTTVSPRDDRPQLQALTAGRDLGDLDDAPRRRRRARPRWTTTSIERVEVLAHGAQRPRRRGLDDQRLQAVQGVEGAVGVARRPRAVVAGVQGLHERQHLRPAHLADDQAVGTQPQRGAHELLERDGVRPVGCRRPGFEAHEVVGRRQQLGGVLDRHDPLARAASGRGRR